MGYYDDVKSYFSNKAEEYDLVDNQLYRVLSDELAKKILYDKVIKNINSEKINLLDAGAGTGRWSLFFNDLIKNSNISISADLVDISSDMLNVAKQKIEKLGIKEFNCSEGNIEDLNALSNNYYDFALSFYNVLSFVDDYKKAIQEVSKKLKEGGIYIGIVSNKYHSNYFSILTNRLEELNKTSEGLIRFNDNMPYIHCFGVQELKKIFLENGFSSISVFGLLNFVYPGMEETFIKGQSEEKENLLKDKGNFNKILDIEYKYCFDEELASRGNCLMFLAVK